MSFQSLTPRRPLSIGLLVDGTCLPAHYYLLCKWAASHECISIKYLIVQKLPISERSSRSFVSRFLRNISKFGFFNYLGHFLYSSII